VSLESCAVCVVNQSGTIVREAKVSGEPEALIAFLRELGQDIACIGLEAGPLSQWLHRYLQDAVLMETRQLRGAIKAMPIKTVNQRRILNR
jgi:transposase